MKARVAGPDVFHFECAPSESPASPVSTAGKLPLSGEGEAWLTYDPVRGLFTVRVEGRAVWVGRAAVPEASQRLGLPGVELTWAAAATECLYGPAGSLPGLNRYGQRIEMWGDARESVGGANGGRTAASAPVVYSSRGYALFCADGSEGLLDLDSSGDGFHRYRRAERSLMFYVAVGNSLRALVEKRAKALGAAPRVPDWAWALWIHDEGRGSRAAADVVGEMMRRGLPVAAVVHEGAPADASRARPSEKDDAEAWQRLVREQRIREFGENGEPFSVTWLAATNATWEAMAATLPAGLSASLSGDPFWGQVIGGRAGEPSPDLFARWLQLAAVSPLMAWRAGDSLEPWDYGEEAEQAWQRLLCLRLNLRPALAALAGVAAETGQPVARPMILEFPGDLRFTNEWTQYMLGHDMLTAPVLEEGRTGRRVSFPDGIWHCALQSAAFSGPGEFDVPIALVDAPLFLREGASLPVQLARGAAFGQWTPDAPVRSLRIEARRAVIRGLVAPLTSNPLRRGALIRFRTGPEFKGPLAARWFFKDAALTPFDAVVGFDGDARTMDLTPPDDAPLVGRTQVYVIQTWDSPEAAQELFRGEIAWPSPVRIEASPSRVSIAGSGQCEVATLLQNVSDEPVEVRVTARAAGSGLHPEPGMQSATVAPGASALLEWDLVWRADEEVGDALATFTAAAGEAALQTCSAAFTRNPRWVAVGPFSAAPGMAGREAFAPELSQDPNVAFATALATQAWEQVESAAVLSAAGLDFGALFGRLAPGCAYAMTRIHSDADRTVELRFGVDDSVSVWLNEARIFRSASGVPAGGGDVVVTARFRQGTNVILVKVCQETGPWRMRFRLTALDEKPAQGLRDGFLSEYAHFAPEREPARVIAAIGNSSAEVDIGAAGAYDETVTLPRLDGGRGTVDEP